MTKHDETTVHEEVHDRIFEACTDAVREAVEKAHTALFAEFKIERSSKEGAALESCIRQEMHGLFARLTGSIETQIRAFDKVDMYTVGAERMERFAQGINDAAENLARDGVTMHAPGCPCHPESLS
jgi:hypothetical protein